MSVVSYIHSFDTRYFRFESKYSRVFYDIVYILSNAIFDIVELRSKPTADISCRFFEMQIASDLAGKRDYL